MKINSKRANVSRRPISRIYIIALLIIHIQWPHTNGRDWHITPNTNSSMHFYFDYIKH